MKSTKKLVISALLASLGVVFLAFGAIVNVFDMSAAVLASILVLFCVLEFGYAYSFAVYAVICVLAILVLPNKSPALMFAALFGYIPIMKFGFDRIFKKFSWLPKLIVYNALFAALIFLAGELLGFTTDNRFGIPAAVIYVLYFVLGDALYVVCDILYARLALLYMRKYRDKIRKYLK